MAKCPNCDQDMTAVDSCNELPVAIAGKVYPVINYGDETRFGKDFGPSRKPDKRCHDCNVRKGKPHHPGCDMEECPACHGQLISCACAR